MDTTLGHGLIRVPPSTLKQHREPTEPTVLSTALASAQSLRALIGLKLAPLGLASGQDRLLLALEAHGQLSISALANVLNVRPSTVSKMMDRLTDRGLTARLHDADDARRTNVALTDEGRAVCRKLRVLCEAIEAELQSDLTDEDTRNMIQGLTLLEEVVAKRLKRLR